MRNQKGFTLIELMVVVLIIAILIAIAVPVFNVARQAAWRRTCQSNLRTINGNIQTYVASNEGSITWSDVLTDIDSSHPFIPNYFQEPPTCPKAVSIDGAGGDAAPCYSIAGTDQTDAHAVCNYYGPGGSGSDATKDHKL